MITAAHEYSITGTMVAREIFDSLMIGDYGVALGKLDQSKKKWNKKELLKTLLILGCDEVGDWRKMKKSASPTIEYTENGFEFRHNIPGSRTWHEAIIVLIFTRNKGEIFHVEMGFE